MALVLTGKQKKKLAEALEKAFRDYAHINTLVMAELDTRLQSVTPPAAMGVVTMELVDWAEGEGKLDDLIRGAIAAKPGSPYLGPAVLDFVTSSPQAPAPSLQGELERQFLRDGDTKNFSHWHAKIEAARRCVCLIQTYEEGELVGLGTGFLIAPDLLMTAHHVARGLTGAGGRAVFDYLQASDDVTTAPYADLENDALIVSSPTDKLDYAVMRLAWPAGSAPRGRLSLRERPADEGAAILILQHPRGRPLEISIGGATSRIAADRLHYSAGTEPGSSGSPVMTLSSSVVAVHHYADEPHKKNRGTQMSAILEDLQRKAPELYSSLAGKPGPPDKPPSGTEGSAGSGPEKDDRRRRDIPTSGGGEGKRPESRYVPPRGEKLVYLSRAPRDKSIAGALKKHFAPLIRAGKMAVQDESDFETGIDEKDARLRFIDAADMVIVCVSRDYLAETPTQDELDRVLPKKGDKHEKRDGQHVVPVLVRPCNLAHSPLEGKTYLPVDNERGQRPINSPDNDGLLSEVAEAISRQLFPEEYKQRPRW